MTEDERRARALQLKYKYRGRRAAPKKEKDSGLEDFGEGLAVSGLKTYYGIKDLFGKMDDEDRATLKDWEEDAAESGWGTAGRVVGEIGQLAVPGGAVLKGARAANMAKNALRATTFGADVGLSAGLGALQAPSEGESRSENALQGATGAALGGALGGVLGKAMRGIRKTDEAQDLIDEGVELTPAQASAGQFPKALESIMERTKFMSGGTTAARQKSLAQWNQKVLQEAAPEGVSVTSAGREGFKQLKDGIDEGYDKAWKAAQEPRKTAYNAIVEEMTQQGRRLDADSQQVLRGAWQDIADLRSSWTPQKLRQVDTNLRSDITRAARAGNRPLMDALKNARRNLRNIHGDGVKEGLRALDSKYDEYLQILGASTSAGARRAEGVFTPQALLDAGYKLGGEEAAKGNTPLEVLSEVGMRTVGQEFPSAMWDTRRALATLSPSPEGAMQRAGRAVLGETDMQKRMRALGAMLRQYGLSGATIGGGIGAE